MKITRYFQSCFVLEEKDARLLFDPSGQEANDTEKFGRVDAVIYTHEHPDHFDAGLAQRFAGEGIAIYANASTAKQMKSQPSIVKDGQEFEVKDIKIKAVEIPHCLMVDGSTSVQNTGYLVAEKFFNPGDGVVGAEGVRASVLTVPISGPDISLHDAYKFVMQIGAKTVVPIHYDYLGGNPDFLARFLDPKDVKLHVLENGASVEF